jgi:hypothetical protein
MGAGETVKLWMSLSVPLLCSSSCTIILKAGETETYKNIAVPHFATAINRDNGKCKGDRDGNLLKRVGKQMLVLRNILMRSRSTIWNGKAWMMNMIFSYLKCEL